MLYLPPGTGLPQRVHGAFVADDEVHRVVEYLKKQGEPQYLDGILEGGVTGEGEEGGSLDAARWRGRSAVRPGGGDRAADAPAVDLAGAAAPAHRLQPRGAPDRAHGARRLVSAMQSNGNREVLVPAGKE